MIKNFGLLEETELHAKDWRAGGISGATKTVLREDGNYTDFLPVLEIQKSSFDTMACVTFSALNCLETLMNVKGVSWNKSDRFTAKMSGTTKDGNYFRNVAESLRAHGTVHEPLWPFPRTDAAFDWNDYYAEIPVDVQAEGVNWLKDYAIEWEIQDTTRLWEALKYGPIQVSVYAWPKPIDGLYTDGGIDTRNHAVMLFNATDEYYEIFDHYTKDIKRLVPNYRFGSARQFYLNPTKPMPSITIPNDTLVQEVNESGSFGLHLNGKIIVDGVDKLLASWLMRNKGEVAGKTMPITKEAWDSFSKVNLKGESV